MTPQEKKERLAEALVQEKERLAGVTKAFITYEDGRTAEGDVICTFDSKDTGFQYFLFRDGTKTAAGLWRAYAARYDVINSVLKHTGFELGEAMEEAELEMVRDLIRTKLAKGLIFKKPLLELCIGGIREVRFE